MNVTWNRNANAFSLPLRFQFLVPCWNRFFYSNCVKQNESYNLIDVRTRSMCVCIFYFSFASFLQKDLMALNRMFVRECNSSVLWLYIFVFGVPQSALHMMFLNSRDEIRYRANTKEKINSRVYWFLLSNPSKAPQWGHVRVLSPHFIIFPRLLHLIIQQFAPHIKWAVRIQWKGLSPFHSESITIVESLRKKHKTKSSVYSVHCGIKSMSMRSTKRSLSRRYYIRIHVNSYSYSLFLY